MTVTVKMRVDETEEKRMCTLYGITNISCNEQGEYTLTQEDGFEYKNFNTTLHCLRVR